MRRGATVDFSFGRWTAGIVATRSEHIHTRERPSLSLLCAKLGYARPVGCAEPTV